MVTILHLHRDILTSNITNTPQNLPDMPPYDDWNKIDEEEEEELQDASVCYDILRLTSCLRFL